MKKRVLAIQIFLLFSLTFGVYSKSLWYDFIWDDDDYVYKNFTMQKWEGIKDIWFSYEMPQYYPVVFTSFWLEHKIWGLNPFWYKLVNILFHIASSVLLFFILLKISTSIAFPVSLLFAIHPLQVESVVWITERKNIYGLFFYLLALVFYLKFWDTFKKRFYGLSLLAFVFALLSKSVTSSFVLVPFFIKWWRNEKIKLIDFLHIAPFLFVGLIAGINTIYLEKVHVGAFGKAWDIGFFAHIVLSGKIVLFYIWKTIFPYELIFFYPRWENNPENFINWVPVVLVCLLLGFFFFYKNKITKTPFACFSYFILSLFPALGFINVFPMLYSWVADHFQYISIIPLLILLVSFVISFIKYIPGVSVRVVSYVLFSLVVVLLMFKTFEHSDDFENVQVLWQRVIEKNPSSWNSHNNLGLEYKARGMYPEALAEFDAALKIKPDLEMAYNNIGIINFDLGKYEIAIKNYEESIKLAPNYSNPYNNLGRIYQLQGKLDLAEKYYKEAIVLNQKLPHAHFNLGSLYREFGRFREAIDEMKIALGLYPLYFEAYNDMGLCYMSLKEYETALEYFNKVLEINPNYAPAHNNIGVVYKELGLDKEALLVFRKTLSINPNFYYSHLNLVDLYLKLNQRDLALEHYKILKDNKVLIQEEYKKKFEQLGVK